MKGTCELEMFALRQRASVTSERAGYRLTVCLPAALVPRLFSQVIVTHHGKMVLIFLFVGDTRYDRLLFN